jgi:hypothetical protein
MLKIASAFVVGMVGSVVFSLVPPELAHRMGLAVERNVEIQMEHLRDWRR